MEKKFLMKIASISFSILIMIFISFHTFNVEEEVINEVVNGSFITSNNTTTDNTLSSSTNDLIIIMVIVLPVIILFSFYDKIMNKY